MALQRYEPEVYRSLLQEYTILFEKSDEGKWVKAEEHEAKVAELEAMIEKMKCCGNCKNQGYHDWGNDCVVPNHVEACLNQNHRHWETFL